MLSDDMALLRLLVYAHAEAIEGQHKTAAEFIRKAGCALWEDIRQHEIDMNAVSFLSELGIRYHHNGKS